MKSSGKRPRRTPPHDVITAFQLWLGILALGIATIPVRVLLMVQNLDDSTAVLLEQVEQQDSLSLTEEQARMWATVAIGAVGVIFVLIFGALLVAAFAMRAGRPWARVVLTAVGIVLVVFAIPALFAGGQTGVLPFVDSALGLVQAVLAVGAIIAMHREESNRYFAGEKRRESA
ncbi:hypothetical protein GCM10011410_29710 [Hoyosella rhizosphaerae]|uniref:Uncharacterized protein n=1 Tax=Hoyosella rhizosphaerae TaxID=1755582 RepID=A0A916UKP6_9ACTN|nr:hypothetical protein GCM10011410_29710 [Hoyosella rhizosphaerae]